MKIAFIVEFPTQFEVPFYQNISEKLKVEGFDAAQPSNKADKNTEWEFHVIYNNTDQQDYLDAELGKKIGWGFNLYEGYTYFIADQSNILKSIEAIINKEKYDFIILNGYKNSYAGLTNLCKSKNIPIALRIDSVLYNLSSIERFLKRIYLSFVYRQFDHFFAVGSETRKYLHWLGINDSNISYFSYATHDEWFTMRAKNDVKLKELKQKWGIKTDKVIISVAKFVERESPWDILEAFKLLNDPEITLVLVGDGDERKKLEAFAASIPHLKVIFTGYAAYTNLAYYYGLADIFIHAAKNEPWGVSVQEALACGCSVIASDKVGSAKDLIHRGINGFVYNYRNIQQLKTQILNCYHIDTDKKREKNIEILSLWSYNSMWENIKNGVIKVLTKRM